MLQKRIALAAFCVLLAAFLRFYRIEAQSFWNDEGNSARIAERSAQLIIEGAAGDIHPPGYYLLLAAWRAATGHSEFALRGLSAFAGIILVALVYRLGKRYFDEPVALCAAFFAAIHPALIYYSQEARMYEWAAMLAAGSWLLADGRWLIADSGWPLADSRPRGGSSSVLRLLSFILLLVSGLYTHYSFAFVVIALNLFAFIQLAPHPTPHASPSTPPTSRSTLHPLLRWLTLQFIALLLFAPWLPIALRQITSWPAAREYLPPLDSLIGVTRWMTVGATIAAATATPAVLGVIMLLLLGLRRRGQILSPLIWLLVPSVATVALGLFSATFAKFLIVGVPALCLLIGNGAAGIFAREVGEPVSLTRGLSYGSSRHRAAAVPSLAGALLVGITAAASLSNLYFNPTYARADYRGIARYLDSIAKPGDAILLNAPNQWEVFTYYHTDTSNVFPVARSRPFDAPAQIAELESIAATHDRLFVIYWGDAQSDPGRVIESWLNEHTFKAYDQWHADVRLAAYAVPRAAAVLQTRTDVAFGDRLILDGYSLNSQTFSPGDILQLTLFWRARSPISERYKVFVHLIGDPSAPPVAQHDGEPGGGLALTTTWQPDQTVADNHGVFIPLDLPPGEYALVVGLYGVDDGARLTHASGDSLFLSAITVR